MERINKMNDYNSVMEKRKINKIALLMVVDGKPCIGIYERVALMARLTRDVDKLVRVHDGVRMREFVIKNGGRNMAMLSLFKSAEKLIPMESKKGDNALEKALAKKLGGRWIGGIKYHPCDIILRDGTRIEVKGLGGSVQPDYDSKTGKLVSSYEKKQAGEDWVSKLLSDWDAFTDGEFND